MENIRDIIKAKTASDLPPESTGARDRIMSYLQELAKDDKDNWMSRRTICSGAKVSQAYTSHVLDELIADGLIERGVVGRKTYFRKKVNEPSS